jgi:hypothetical protein
MSVAAAARIAAGFPHEKSALDQIVSHAAATARV